MPPPQILAFFLRLLTHLCSLLPAFTTVRCLFKLTTPHIRDPHQSIVQKACRFALPHLTHIIRHCYPTMASAHINSLAAARVRSSGISGSKISSRHGGILSTPSATGNGGPALRSIKTPGTTQSVRSKPSFSYSFFTSLPPPPPLSILLVLACW